METHLYTTHHKQVGFLSFDSNKWNTTTGTVFASIQFKLFIPGHSEAVDLMLSRFEGIVDPNCRNSTGLTPLMKAGLQGRTRCAKSLISAGKKDLVPNDNEIHESISICILKCSKGICGLYTYSLLMYDLFVSYTYIRIISFGRFTGHDSWRTAW